MMMEAMFRIICLFSIILLSTADDKMTSVVNPNCGQECKEQHEGRDVFLVYTHSIVGNDSYHYIWSTIGRSPSFLVAQASPEAELNIDWTKLLSNDPSSSVNLTEHPARVISFILNDVIVWDDINKTGSFEPSKHNFTHFDWNNFTTLTCTPDFKEKCSDDPKCGLTSAAANFSFTNEDGSFGISIETSARLALGRHEALPRILMSPSSFHAELVIFGETGLNYSHPRVFLPLNIIHSNDSVKISRVSRIDDEFSPGVFSDDTLSVGSEGMKSYVTWKPIGYSKDDRIIAHTLDASRQFSADLKPLDKELAPPIYGFYQPKFDKEYSANDLMIFLGSEKDIFYSESNYTSFSFNVGLGEPAEEGLSLMVKMVILVGFGLPAIALLLSTVFVGYRRWRRARGGVLEDISASSY